jgi:hypothetical protein
MRVSWIRSGLVLCGVLACAQSSTACDTSTAACAIQSAPLDQDVTLTVRTPVEFGPSRLRVRFDSVLQDSRCPTDVQCVWAGNAAARVRVQISSDVEQTIDLNTNVGAKEAQFDGYVLRLVSLGPDPVSTTRIEPAAYRLTVRVERP